MLSLTMDTNMNVSEQCKSAAYMANQIIETIRIHIADKE